MGLPLWFARKRPPCLTKRCATRPQAYRPHLEILEQRCLLTLFTVTSSADNGANTLRADLAAAANGDTINFNVTSPITLTSGTLTVAKSVTIQGPGANLLTIQGNKTFGIFAINVGVTATIAGLTISGGNTIGSMGMVSTSGGGIANSGNATVQNCTLSGDSAGAGGGMFNGGTATVQNCTLSGDTASSGGGIWNAGTLTVQNSTLSGDTASISGGGIYNLMTLTVQNCTLSGNSAANGGGIGNGSGLGESLQDTIVAGNMGTTAPDISGTVTSQGHNLIGNTSGAAGFVASDLQNVPSGLDLGGLKNNGGPTQTIALLPGSPAIDAATPVVGSTTDQRGIARPQGIGPDIGAFESRGFTLTLTGGNNQTTTVGTAFVVPLIVTVSSAFGEPVAGGIVTCTAPTSGASAILSTTTAMIAANGQTSVTAVANAQRGTYQVTAVASGAVGVAFSLQNTGGFIAVGAGAGGGPKWSFMMHILAPSYPASSHSHPPSPVASRWPKQTSTETEPPTSFARPAPVEGRRSSSSMAPNSASYSPTARSPPLRSLEVSSPSRRVSPVG